MSVRTQVSRFITTATRSFGAKMPSYLRRVFCRLKSNVDTPSERRTMSHWVRSSDTSRMPFFSVLT